MHIPTTLKHKPVLVAEDYGRIDGRTAYGSDAQGLSLGLAQWNDRGKVDISAKVWRHTGEKWSRQSEELPLHRVLDLAILACRAQLYFQEEAYRFPRGYAEPELTFSDAGQVPDWASGYLRSLVGQGVITGNDNRIRPNDLLTRGEVAKLLYAML